MTHNYNQSLEPLDFSEKTNNKIDQEIVFSNIIFRSIEQTNLIFEKPKLERSVADSFFEEIFDETEFSFF